MQFMHACRMFSGNVCKQNPWYVFHSTIKHQMDSPTTHPQNITHKLLAVNVVPSN